MSSVAIPKHGLSLQDAQAAGDSSSGLSNISVQAMRLNLTDAMLEEMVKVVRAGGKGVQLCFGKNSTLYYDNRSRGLALATEATRQEIYQCIPSESETLLSVSGLVSHTLQVKKVEETTGGTDAALVALQSKMAALDKEKQSKKTLYVPDSTQLPPAKPGKRPPVKTANTSTLTKLNRSLLLNHGTTRSMPTSPALGATRRLEVTSSQPPTSASISQSTDSAKREALRVPLLHLLAVRPTSEKMLSQQTHCSKDDCLEILQKVGRPSRSSATWELSDRAYKNLDVWRFSYPTQDDRQAAIENAVSAFDRLRVSREDKLWQMLLPKSERGQGKILSRLHLHTGPIQRSVTPNIQIRRAEDANLAANVSSAGDEDDVNSQRLIPNQSESMVRSRSQDQITKKKVSEKEALSKRLLSNNSKKTARTAVKSKNTKVSEKRVSVQKDSRANNGKIKSAEFVNESDVEFDIEQASSGKPALSMNSDSFSQTAPATAGDDATETVDNPVNSSSRSLEGKSELRKMIHRSKSPESERSLSSNLSKFPSSSQQSNTSPSSSSSRPSLNGFSRCRTMSSPQKPSPLGSSPPTNASDLENEMGSYNAGSSSSSPNVSQIQQETPTPQTGTAFNRRTPHNTTERSLKRKADDIDSGIHDHESLSVRRDRDPNKRHQSSLSAGVSSDSSDSTSPISSHQTLVLAQRFKKYYAQYAKMHRELSELLDPPADRVKKLTDMHNRLLSMKADITKAAVVTT